ncbi:hypothetical protein LCGC14_0810900 [marine sediment metagenome]|uniref:Uncharacterized protein n=1 Tax=marine sediment metagenome TaxID=412755 RepID=A0A0F9S6R5_9ZZZZ
MRLPRPAPLATLDYPSVMCLNRNGHEYHDYRARPMFHGVASSLPDGWYHCCGRAVGGRKSKRSHPCRTSLR